jgi:outer membrane protein
MLPLWLSAQPAHAQQAGDTLLRVGWLYGHGLDTDTAVHTVLRSGNPLLGIPQVFDTEGLSAHPEDIDTLAVSAAHFLSDCISIQLDVGIPPALEIRGHGIAAPPGSTAALFRVDVGDPQNNPVIRLRQWSPVLSLEYFGGDVDQRLRPFAALGVSYAWFTHVELDPDFEREIKQNFGVPLATFAGKPGPTTVHVDVDAVWVPVVKLGLSYSLSEHWGLSAAALYIPYSAQTRARLSAADGTTLGTMRVRVDGEAIGSALTVAYTFDP